MLDAVQQGTPCLLVNKSGKAADLMSDAVRLCFPVGHKMHIERASFNKRQEALCKQFEQLCDASYESGKWPCGSEYLMPFQRKEKQENDESPWWELYDLPKPDPILIEELFILANSGKCWVFDLSTGHQTGDFKDFMLRRLLRDVEEDFQARKRPFQDELNQILEILLSQASRKTEEEHAMMIVRQETRIRKSLKRLEGLIKAVLKQEKMFVQITLDFIEDEDNLYFLKEIKHLNDQIPQPKKEDIGSSTSSEPSETLETRESLKVQIQELKENAIKIRKKALESRKSKKGKEKQEEESKLDKLIGRLRDSLDHKQKLMEAKQKTLKEKHEKFAKRNDLQPEIKNVNTRFDVWKKLKGLKNQTTGQNDAEEVSMLQLSEDILVLNKDISIIRRTKEKISKELKALKSQKSDNTSNESNSHSEDQLSKEIEVLNQRICGIQDLKKVGAKLQQISKISNFVDSRIAFIAALEEQQKLIAAGEGQQMDHSKALHLKEKLLKLLTHDKPLDIQVPKELQQLFVRRAWEKKLRLAVKFESPKVLSKVIKQAWKDGVMKKFILKALEELFVNTINHSTAAVVEVLLEELPYLEVLAISWKRMMQSFLETESDVEVQRSLRLLNIAVGETPSLLQTSGENKDLANGNKSVFEQNLPATEDLSFDISDFCISNFPKDKGSLKTVISQLKDKQEAITKHIQELCDRSFTYKIGAGGPFADLFLSNLVADRLDLADLIWKRWIPDVDKSDQFWTEAIDPIAYALMVLTCLLV